MSKSILQKKKILTKAGGSSSISTPVSVANGGTGLSSYAVGDIIYASGTTTLSKLAIGTANQQLRVNAGATALEYFTPSSGGITVGTTTITSGTSTRIAFNDGGVYGEDADFTWNKTTNKLNTTSGYQINGYEFYYADAGAGYNCLSVGNSQSAALPTAAGGTFIGIGVGGGAATTGLGNTLIGRRSGHSGITGNNNIAIGIGSTYNGHAFNFTLFLGSGYVSNPGNVTASNQAVFGSSVAGEGYTQFYLGNGVTTASPSSTTINASGGSGTNNAGASLTKAAGKGTGTAAGGNNVEQTSVKLTSGTTIQPLTDRHNIVGKYVDITGGAATTFANLALTTSSTIAGGVIVYTVEANDGTDFQSLSGSAPYSVVNKAGTLTYVLGTDTQSSACSTGTLTGTLSLAAASTTLAFQMNAVSSLSETVLRVSFQVLNNMGVATITAV